MCIKWRSLTWPASEPVNQLFGSTQVCTHPDWSAFPPWLQRGGGGRDWLVGLPSLATECRGEVVVQTGWPAFPPWLQSAEGRWWYRLAGQPSLPGYRVQREGGGTDWLASLPSLATEYRGEGLPSLATECRGEMVVQTGWSAFPPWLQSAEGRWWYRLAGQPSLPGYRVQRGGGGTDWLASLPSLATECRGEVVVQTGWPAFPPWLQSTEGRWWYRLAGQPSLPGYRVQRGGGGTDWLASLPSLATEYRGEVVVQTGWSAFPPWLQSTEGRWWYRLAGQPSLPGYRVQRGGDGTDWLACLPSLATECRGEVVVQTCWLAFPPWLQSTEGRWWYRLAGWPSLPGYRVQRGGGGTDWLASLPSLATECRGEVVVQTGWPAFPPWLQSAEGRWWYRLAGQPSLPGYRVQRGGGGTDWLGPSLWVQPVPRKLTRSGATAEVAGGGGYSCLAS